MFEVNLLMEILTVSLQLSSNPVIGTFNSTLSKKSETLSKYSSIFFFRIIKIFCRNVFKIIRNVDSHMEHVDVSEKVLIVLFSIFSLLDRNRF